MFFLSWHLDSSFEVKQALIGCNTSDLWFGLRIGRIVGSQDLIDLALGYFWRVLGFQRTFTVKLASCNCTLSTCSRGFDQQAVCRDDHVILQDNKITNLNVLAVNCLCLIRVRWSFTLVRIYNFYNALMFNSINQLVHFGSFIVGQPLLKNSEEQDDQDHDSDVPGTVCTK